MKYRRLWAIVLCAAFLLLFVPTRPAAAAPDTEVTQIAAGFTHTAAIRADGSLWIWGSNDYYQLGDGTDISCAVPLKRLEQVTAVSVGFTHTAAILSDGSLWTWGENWYGQLGDGTEEDRTVPVKIMDGVVAVSAGGYHTAAIRTDGSLWAWGRNWNGQLGDGTTTERTAPVKILDDVISVSTGSFFTAAVLTDGSLWMWGDNTSGQLGDGIFTNRSAPGKVLDGVASVSAGGGHTAAILADGALWTWGDNTVGQLGDGTFTNRTAPVKVLGGVAAVSAGDGHTAAVLTDGSLLTWGGNYYEQLGDGTLSNCAVPTKVLDGVAAVAAGGAHTIALKTDGTIWAWGNNSYGQLGNGIEDWRGNDNHYLHTQIFLNDANVPMQTIRFAAGLYDVYDQPDRLGYVPRGGTATPPPDPQWHGYLFAGWYYDNTRTEPVNFQTDTFARSTTLYAQWLPSPTDPNLPATGTAHATSGTYPCLIDGAAVTLSTYAVKDADGNDTNYVKLRDLAAALSSTRAQFNVDWDGRILIQSGTPYTTPNGAEGAPNAAQVPYTAAPTVLSIDTWPLAALPITITDAAGGGHTYFKLRDLGNLLGFSVTWDGARGAMVIDTTAVVGGIALITDIGTIDDLSYNEGAWRGILAYASARDIPYVYYQPSEQSNNAYLGQISRAVASGAKVIVTPGFLFEEPIFIAQDRYPNVTFIMLDASPHNADYTEFYTAPNTVGIFYAEEQAGFLAGYAAVKGGYTRLGFMGGMAVPAVVRYGFGFVQGAEAAALEMGVGSIEMMYHYTGGFEATPEITQLATEWYNDGTEIIFACGGAAGFSVMAAAEKAGGFVIGVDVDQSPESPTVITSAMKNLSGSTEQMLAHYYEGAFPGGQTVTLGAAQNGVLLPMKTTKIDGFTQADYDAIYAKLASGDYHGLVFDDDWLDVWPATPDVLPLTVTVIRYIP